MLQWQSMWLEQLAKKQQELTKRFEQQPGPAAQSASWHDRLLARSVCTAPFTSSFRNSSWPSQRVQDARASWPSAADLPPRSAAARLVAILSVARCSSLMMY